jgi:hypothetical protein
MTELAELSMLHGFLKGASGERPSLPLRFVAGHAAFV